MKIAFHTLGCKLNFSETSFIANNLKDENFKNGHKDATTFVLLSNKLLQPDDPDPKLEEAKKLVPQMEEENKSLLGIVYTEKELEKGGELKVALLLVTIVDYINAKWIN